MRYGLAIFPTDYAIPPAELGQAAEERGFESLWVAEHSHIPASRRTPFPGGGELPKMYYDAMDPFVSLAAAAAVTRRLKVGTGICLVVQRDPIQTAKEVASLDQISRGRFLFGVGAGWNAEEMENHGTTDYAGRFALMRERIEAMKEIWTKKEAEYHGERVDFDPIIAWPKPFQKPHPPIHVGGGFPAGARRAIRYGDGWMPVALQGDPLQHVPAFRKMAEEAGRKDLELSLYGVPGNPDVLARQRDAGVDRAILALPPAPAEDVLRILDGHAELVRRVG